MPSQLGSAALEATAVGSAAMRGTMGARGIEEFLARYGEKGYLVIKAILSAADSNWLGGSLGDFSYKMLREKLEEMGVSYNPSPLLSRLEKTYGLIETTYKSGGQHWWRIVDREALERGVRLYEGVEEPDPQEDYGETSYRVKLLRIQFYSLNPQSLLETLARLSRKKRLADYDRRVLRRIVFEELPLLVDFLEKAQEEYPEELSQEISLAETILDMVEKIVQPSHPARVGGRLGRETTPPRLSQATPFYRDREPF